MPDGTQCSESDGATPASNGRSRAKSVSAAVALTRLNDEEVRNYKLAARGLLADIIRSYRVREEGESHEQQQET